MPIHDLTEDSGALADSISSVASRAEAQTAMSDRLIAQISDLSEIAASLTKKQAVEKMS